MKLNWLAIFEVIFLVSTLILLVYIYKGMNSDGGKCLKEPFVYGANKLEQHYGQSVTGYYLIENRGSMSFNSTTMIAGENIWLESYLK